MGEAAELEVARVVGDFKVADAVVGESESGEPGTLAETDGEAVRVVGGHAASEGEGVEGGGGEEVRGEALHAVLREVVFGDVEVDEFAEGVEELGERVEVGAAIW